jgi:hypothetical protein
MDRYQQRCVIKFLFLQGRGCQAIHHELADVIPKTSHMIGSKKMMITIFFTDVPLIALQYLPRGQKYNKEYFTNVICEDINETCNHGRGQRVIKDIFIHTDNWKLHNCQESSRRKDA